MVEVQSTSLSDQALGQTSVTELDRTRLLEELLLRKSEFFFFFLFLYAKLRYPSVFNLD